jgi:hypothetical protein
MRGEPRPAAGHTIRRLRTRHCLASSRIVCCGLRSSPSQSIPPYAITRYSLSTTEHVSRLGRRPTLDGVCARRLLAAHAGKASVRCAASLHLTTNARIRAREQIWMRQYAFSPKLSRHMLPLPMQDSLPAGWLAFTGRELHPLERVERFPSCYNSSPLPGFILTLRKLTSRTCERRANRILRLGQATVQVQVQVQRGAPDFGPAPWSPKGTIDGSRS